MCFKLLKVRNIVGRSGFYLWLTRWPWKHPNMMTLPMLISNTYYIRKYLLLVLHLTPNSLWNKESDLTLTLDPLTLSYNFKPSSVPTLGLSMIEILILTGQQWAPKYRQIDSIKPYLDALRWDFMRENRQSGDGYRFGYEIRVYRFLAKVFQLYNHPLHGCHHSVNRGNIWFLTWAMCWVN